MFNSHLFRGHFSQFFHAASAQKSPSGRAFFISEKGGT